MKKITVALLILVLSLLMCMTALGAYSDMPEGADGQILQRAIDNGLISGFEDGTLRPSAPITRAQMATIISRALNAQNKKSLDAFTDVEKSAWYYDAMSKAVGMEAFKGDAENRLNPDSNISRQEALIVLCRIFDLPRKTAEVLQPYSDASSVADWATKEVAAIVYGNYLDSSDAIRPLDAMTRLEFAKIMDNLVKVYIDEDGEYTTLPEGNILVRAQNVSLKGIATDANVFISDGTKGNVELTECTFRDIIIRGGKAILNSGAYARIRAIGEKTFAEFKNDAAKMVRKRADGTSENIYLYGAIGKGTLIFPQKQIDSLN